MPSKLTKCRKCTSTCYSNTDMGEIPLSATANIMGCLTWSWWRVSNDSAAAVGVWGYSSSFLLINVASFQVAFQPLVHLMSCH